MIEVDVFVDIGLVVAKPIAVTIEGAELDESSSGIVNRDEDVTLVDARCRVDANHVEDAECNHLFYVRYGPTLIRRFGA